MFNKLFKEFSFYLKKSVSSKFIRKGNCNQCGSCCRNIVFMADKGAIRTEEQFRQMKIWNKYYNNFYISGKDKDNVLLFTCKSLQDDNKCRDYFYRSLYCRTYPHIRTKLLVNGGKLLDGCGFYFDVDKRFENYLKD